MRDSTVILKKDYRYICIDLETSGLDKDKDYMIQIGIIALDENGNLLDFFSSYINPGEGNEKLNDVVSHLTSITEENLLNAPSLEKVEEQIAKYFGEDVILIGHNISFDQGFLKKSMPSLTRHGNIDTFEISGSSIPYLKSYALENIHAHLLQYKHYITIYEDNKEKVCGLEKEPRNHDALYDSLLCLCIIQRWLHHICILIEKYPYLILSYMKVDNSEGYISITKNHIDTNNNHSLESIGRPFIAKEQKKNDKKMAKEIFTGQSNKISMKGLNIRELIDQLPQPSLIAVSHPSKIDIIKNACPEYHFDYLKDDQIIDFTLYNKWIKKDNLSMHERLFGVLYASHASLGYSILQPILPLHKYILSYITEKNVPKSYHNHILCTHGGLYAYREQNPDRSNKLNHYTICMRDIDRWYITYNDYASKYVNPQSLLFPRDEFLYHRKNDNILYPTKQKDLSDYEKIYGDILMFLGLFYIESNNIHQQKKSQQRELSCSDSPSYERSMTLWKPIYTTWQIISTVDEKKSYLGKKMEKIDKLLSQESKIQYTQSPGKEGYYTLTPLHRYIDFSEYNDLFEQHKYYFFSTHRTEYTALPHITEPKEKINIKDIKSIKLLDQEIINSSDKNIFIISHNSEKSKQLFSHRRTQPYIQNKEILAEYITGGIQKNVAKGNRIDNKSLLMIGGYHYLLNTRGSKVTIDTVIIYYTPKAWESFIHDDIARYVPFS